MPNFKSDVIISPLIEAKRMTYSVDFKINNGSFTSFASKIHQEFTEDVADQGVSFSKVEFPELSGVNIGINRWDGITFKYKGEDKTKTELSALVFKENIELTIDARVMPNKFKAVFIKANGVHYDGEGGRNHIVNADAPNYKITSTPRVELGLTEKVYNELYKFNNKWKMHTVKIESGIETPDQYIQDIRSTELLDHVFDKDLAFTPILEKKDINAVFIQDDTKYLYPSGFNKHQVLQVENIGDKNISMSKIQFPETVSVIDGAAVWEGKKWIIQVDGVTDSIMGTKEELASKTFNNTLHVEPFVALLPPPDPSNSEIYTELVTNRDGKKYYIKPDDNDSWLKSIEVDATTEDDRNTLIKIKRVHLKDIYSSLVIDEEHWYKYYVKPEDVSKWNNFEKVQGIREYDMNNQFWNDAIIMNYKKLHMSEKFKFDIQHGGKTYYLRTGGNVREYYEFIQVKAWKGEIDDFFDENAYETIKRPVVEPPVKGDTPTTPGKVKVTFWGGPDCDLVGTPDPTVVELDEESAEGASLANLTFPSIKFKSFIRNDIDYSLNEGEWNISYMKNDRWRTLTRSTNSIKKITAKGNVLIRPNPGKQR